MAKKAEKVTKVTESPSADGATERIMTLKKEIQKLRLELVAGKLKNTSELSKKRKEIARLLTAASAKKYE